ncbi:SRPBCC domain-containing protein [Maritalea mediterranea]|uniref:SRPBCC domain-containing protein n=1 Tax=Maritalea mediterranea TaxID=2909667 RepID=A0ABS9E729_9HYPH|nr:SRPBCC domain-containing protein [Maritalea mediterranea]MCF4097575.1 SRPBCC domain-containing protein [Maritalea mediterranea]
MKTYQSKIEIAASVENVWRALLDGLQTDPQPFGIIKLEGELAAGSRLKLWSEVDPNRAFALQIISFQPPHKMVWRGGMPFGLFTGTRTFILRRSGETTIFEMEEIFKGALAGLIVKSMPDLNPSFEKFALALKQKAENYE